MSYSAMGHQSAGYVVTASNYNQFTDNDAACAVAAFTTKGDIFAATGSAAGARLAAGSDYKSLAALSTASSGLAYVPSPNYIDFSTTVTEFSNSSSEQTLYTKDITQSLYTSSKNRVLVCDFQCQLYNNKAASTIQYSYKFKFGAVTLTCGAFSQSSPANAYYDVVIRAWVMGNGATNAQIIGGNSCWYWGGSPTLYSPATTTGTVDSTASVTVSLTCQMNTADANGKNRFLFGGISTIYP